MSDAPERIWVEKSIAEKGNHGSTAWLNPDHDSDIEYHRADISAELVRAGVLAASGMSNVELLADDPEAIAAIVASVTEGGE